MKKRLPIIIFLILLVLAIAGGVFFYFSNKTKFNDDYVNGNTAGNLYNEGLFCEYDGIIYFANPSDNDKLYSMNPDGSNLTKLCDDIVSFINADEHYLYYVRNNPGGGGNFSFLTINTNSLCRIDREGGDDSILVLDSEPSMYASLVGNYIYYLHYSDSNGTTLYKVKIDGSEKEEVQSASFFTASTLGQYVYYNGVETDHYIWRLNTQDDSYGMLYGGNCWMPTVVDETTAYFMDCDNNYCIARVDLTTGDKTIICEDRVDWYNVFGSYIYFQRNNIDNKDEEPALCRMRTDGSDYEVLATGNHLNINTTSTYVYFREYGSGQAFRIANTVNAEVEAFAPGTVIDKE